MVTAVRLTTRMREFYKVFKPLDWSLATRMGHWPHRVGVPRPCAITGPADSAGGPGVRRGRGLSRVTQPAAGSFAARAEQAGVECGGGGSRWLTLTSAPTLPATARSNEAVLTENTAASTARKKDRQQSCAAIVSIRPAAEAVLMDPARSSHQPASPSLSRASGLSRSTNARSNAARASPHAPKASTSSPGRHSARLCSGMKRRHTVL